MTATPGSRNILDYGADPAGAADSTAAVQAALDAGPGTVCVPPGTYKLSATLHVRRGLRLVGAAGSQWFCPSILQWGPDSHGLIVDSHTANPDGSRGDWAQIENLALKQMYRISSTQPWHGVTLHAPATLRGVWANAWSGDGFHVEGSTPTANPNLWQIDNCQANECAGDGLLVRGNDSNAGLCTLFDSVANGGWGISDQSFLGNTYVGCHTAGCRTGSYQTTGGVNYSRFLGCYAEAGQPCQFNDETLVLWGQYGCSVLGGLRLLPGDTHLKLKCAQPGDPVLLLVGMQGQVAPAIVVTDHNETPLLTIGSDGSLRVLAGARGLYLQSFDGQAPVVFAINDRTTGYVGPVGDWFPSTVGGGYGDGRVSLRMYAIDPATNQPMMLEALRLQRDRATVGRGGLELPSLTTVQRDALANKVAGLVVFNTDVGAMQCYDGMTWN